MGRIIVILSLFAFLATQANLQSINTAWQFCYVSILALLHYSYSTACLPLLCGTVYKVLYIVYIMGDTVSDTSVADLDILKDVGTDMLSQTGNVKTVMKCTEKLQWKSLWNLESPKRFWRRICLKVMTGGVTKLRSLDYCNGVDLDDDSVWYADEITTHLNKPCFDNKGNNNEQNTL